MINKDLVFLDYEADSREQIIEKVASKMFEQGKLHDEATYAQSVLDREKQFSTCFDFEVAIPHGKSDAVKESCFAFVRLKDKLQWCSDNENKAKLVFMIAVPESDKDDTHLKILAKLSRNLMHDDFREKMLTLETEEEIVEELKKIIN